MSPRLILDRSTALPQQAPELDPDQQRVVSHRGGPLLVLAGPGTGKTTTLVEAMVARLTGEQPLAPDQVLGLTFGRKAADEWRDRVLARIGAGMAPTISTFHAFAWSIVRAHPDRLQFPRAPRLLSGAEEDAKVRELLAGAIELGTLPWPDDLAAALNAPIGLGTELRNVLIRARLLGMTPDELRRAADNANDGGWRAAAAFMQEYEDVFGEEASIDYAALIGSAMSVLQLHPDLANEWRGKFQAIFVDEYQDTDPAQAQLIRLLAGPQATVIAVGDPDQSIYAFRGAAITNIENFQKEFGGTQGPVILGRGRRFGPAIRQAATNIVASMAYPNLSQYLAQHRAVDCSQAATPGSVSVLHFPNEGTQAAHIADQVRRLGLRGDHAWSDIAVLVRSRSAIPALQRAFIMAGVPVHVGQDDVPLFHDPAVAPLLMALRVVARPSELTPEVAHSLLLSPLGGADTADIRRVARALRREERREDPLAPQTPSATIVRNAINDPSVLAAIANGPAAQGVQAIQQVHTLLRNSRKALKANKSVPEILWQIWNGTSWPQNLKQTALSGGLSGRRADRDLDAICMLFELAHEGSRRSARQGVIPFLQNLQEQQVAATIRESGHTSAPCVQLMTAHRAKGLQWKTVIVAGVQEGLWPDVRRRGTVLQADRLGVDGQILNPVTASEILNEERRLFYVAVTRATDNLIVTAVAGGVDGDQPSRFLEQLGVEPVLIESRPARALALAPLVAVLRRTLESDASPALKAAAAQRLHTLSAWTSLANPQNWWGVRELTTNERPVRPLDEPVRLSGSAITSIDACPRKWFLEREARAETASSEAQSFGKVLHVVAEFVAKGELPADPQVLEQHIDSVWSRIGYPTPWYSAVQRKEASAALARFLDWHRKQRAAGHTTVGLEERFDADLTIIGDDGQSYPVHISGFVDRIELLAGQGPRQVQIFDFKTESRPGSDKQMHAHPQLALYQLAVLNNGFQNPQLQGAIPAGAGLVQLRVDASSKDPGVAKVQQQAALVSGHDASAEEETQTSLNGTFIEDLLGVSARVIRAEDFVAIPDNGGCQWCAFASSCPAKSDGTEVIA